MKTVVISAVLAVGALAQLSETPMDDHPSGTPSMQNSTTPEMQTSTPSRPPPPPGTISQRRQLEENCHFCRTNCGALSLNVKPISEASAMIAACVTNLCKPFCVRVKFSDPLNMPRCPKMPVCGTCTEAVTCVAPNKKCPTLAPSACPECPKVESAACPVCPKVESQPVVCQCKCDKPSS